MDRHDVSEEVTAENVAQLHKQDLKIQHKFGCRGLTYWFDEKRGTAFCLIEAPDKQTIEKMHNQAHGEVPNQIIEVDSKIVESFLGRIEDPENAQNAGLNIINDPAFRMVMVIGLEIISLKKHGANKFISPLQKHNESFIRILSRFQGSVVKQNADYFLVSFESVTKAVLCALDLQSGFAELNNGIDKDTINIKIGLSAGVPVTEKASLFEDTIKSAERMCNNVKHQIVLSTEVKELYKSENINVFINNKSVFTLSPADEKLLNLLIDYTERNWGNANLNVDDFNRQLGFSKSQLYRKMISVTGKSPNTFLKEYRLNEALKLLNKQTGNISEIAFETGFSSLSYFSKCFQNRYGLLPSDYLRTKRS
ncbi:MAG: nickel-binding protein [Ignavibacteriaceae bacterium]